MMGEGIVTNEWTKADRIKPPRRRLVLVRFDDDTYGLARWNGAYWVGQHNMRLMRMDKVEWWYMFEAWNEREED